MKMVLRTGLIVAASLSLVSCSLLTGGLEPKISLGKGEISKIKETGPVVITGMIAAGDKDGTADKAALGAAVLAFGKKSRPAQALKVALDAVGGGAVADIATITHQSAFNKATKNWAKKKFALNASPKKLQLPKGAFTKVSMKNPKKALKSLQNEAKALGELAKALQAGDQKKLDAALNKSKNAVAVVNKVSGWLYDQLDAKYILLSKLEGDEKSWEAGKQMRLIVGLANVKTGQFRFLAQVAAKKGTIPVPYNLQAGLMMNSILEGAGENDPALAIKIPEQAPDEAPTAIVEE